MTTDIEKIILLNVEGIARKSGTDQHGRAWIQYDIDPLARDPDHCLQSCDGFECDPDTCPRFYDECAECRQKFYVSGWLCLDGGETACEDCVSPRADSNGN